MIRIGITPGFIPVVKKYFSYTANRFNGLPGVSLLKMNPPMVKIKTGEMDVCQVNNLPDANR